MKFLFPNEDDEESKSYRALIEHMERETFMAFSIPGLRKPPFTPGRIKKLEAENERLKAECDKLKKDIKIMVEKAADKHLPAYREQGQKMLKLQRENERLWRELTNVIGRK